MQIYQGSRCVTFTFKIFKQKLFLKSLISHSILQLAPFSPTDVIWKQYFFNWCRGKVSKLPTCEKHISRENFWFHTCPRWDFWSQLFFSKFCWLVFDLWATSTAILRRSASFLFLCGLIFVVIALCKNIIFMVCSGWTDQDQSHLEYFLPNSYYFPRIPEKNNCIIRKYFTLLTNSP